MGIETLILGVNESVTDVLRYSVDADRDTLNVGLYLVEDNEFLITVGVFMDTVEVGIGTRFQFLEGYLCGFVHEVEDVNRKSGTYDSTRDNDHEEE